MGVEGRGREKRGEKKRGGKKGEESTEQPSSWPTEKDKMGNNQLLLPSVTWHPCHRLMGSWGMGDGPELGMKRQRPDQTSGRHN